MSRPALHLTIRGRVQGVGYRWWTVGQATALGLSGWVRNRRDGSVELLAIGSTDAIETLATACTRGPTVASVASVERAPAEDDGTQGFEQRPTV